MDKSYRHIFFDLDHTLWDYEKSARETLKEIFTDFQLEDKTSLTEEGFITAFKKINQLLWDQYNHDQIDSKTLRHLRFRLVLESFNEISSTTIEGINETFMEVCPKKPNLIEGALEVLEFLKVGYSLHIITNGFEKTQHTKLKYCSILENFETITTSESARSKKPDGKIFEYALGLAKSKLSEAVMIGDNLRTDILGAKSFGIDQIHLNTGDSDPELEPTYSIERLLELKSIL